MSGQWTQVDLALLRGWYATRSNAEIALDLGRTRFAVLAMARNQGLKKAASPTRTGLPCRQCGETKRFVANGHCIHWRQHRAPPGEPRKHPGGYPGARARAFAAGQKKYIGKPCSDCGGTVYHTSNYHCVDCASRRPAGRSYRAQAEQREAA